ncbi:MAG: OmpW family outer membrane protein [Thermodesulfobacteriota bacterium]
MKRDHVLLAVLCLLLCFSSRPALAGSDAGTLGVGARVGYQWFANDTVDNVEVTLDPCGVFGVNALYFPLKNLGVEVAGEFQRTKINVGGPEAGDLSTIGLLLTLRYQPTIWGRFMPYVGAGGGYYFQEFDHISLYIARRWQPRGYVPADINLEDGFGAHLSAGIDIPIDKELIKGAALNMECRYNFLKTKQEKLADAPDIKLDGFILSGGFKYFFK